MQHQMIGYIFECTRGYFELSSCCVPCSDPELSQSPYLLRDKCFLCVIKFDSERHSRMDYHKFHPVEILF